MTTRRRCCSRTDVRLRSATAPGGSGRISRRASLPALLDYNRAPGRPRRTFGKRRCCAPLVTRDSLVGVLKIAARYPEQLKPFDAELVEHFRSQAAIAIQNLHRPSRSAPAW